MTEFGIRESKSYSDTLQRFPKTKHVRPFVGGILPVGADLAGKINVLAKPALDKGLIPWVSFKLRPTDVVGGKWDAALEKVAFTVDPKVRLIPWHEPENDMSAGNFTAMFNTVANRIHSAGKGHILVYSAMAYQFRTSTTTTTKTDAWFPVTADYMACDVYSSEVYTNNFPLTAILPEHDGFKRWNAARLRVASGVPWGITERGFTTETQHQVRADTIRREAEWVESSGMGHYLYWNSSGAENNPDLVLDAKGEEAVRYLADAITTEPISEYDRGYRDGTTAGQLAGYDMGYRDGYVSGQDSGKAGAIESVRNFLEELES